MKPATRNLWLEVMAFALILIHLALVLGAVITTATFVINQMLKEPPISTHGMVVGPTEALVAALCMIVPAIGLVAAAWGLRSLLAGEEADGEPSPSAARRSFP